MRSVVAPHSTAAASIIRSPIRAVADGSDRLSCTASASPAKAQIKPAPCAIPIRSFGSRKWAPTATTKGAVYKKRMLRATSVKTSAQ
jgi:hypothetical protein